MMTGKIKSGWIAFMALLIVSSLSGFVIGENTIIQSHPISEVEGLDLNSNGIVDYVDYAESALNLKAELPDGVIGVIVFDGVSTGECRKCRIEKYNLRVIGGIERIICEECLKCEYGKAWGAASCRDYEYLHGYKNTTYNASVVECSRGEPKKVFRIKYNDCGNIKCCVNPAREDCKDIVKTVIKEIYFCVA